MRTVLLTGGAGFIGSCLVRQWVQARFARVVNVDKLTYAGHLESLGEALTDPDHVFVEGDVCDGRLLWELFHRFQPDAVVHLAAESHVDRSIEAPAQFAMTNVVGTFEILDAALQFWRTLPSERRARFRFLHVSTDEVFGSIEQQPAVDEDAAYRPSSPYAASKAAGDHFARAYFRTFGLPVIVTHCSNNYGPFQFPEKLIPLVVLNALDGLPLPIYGDGQFVRDWIHVEDHCRALTFVLNDGRPGVTYNVAGGSERTNLDVVRAICATVDHLQPDSPHRPCERLIAFVADRPGHDRRYAIDDSRIRRELNWRPQVSFQEGLDRTIGWYLTHRSWAEQVLNRSRRPQSIH